MSQSYGSPKFLRNVGFNATRLAKEMEEHTIKLLAACICSEYSGLRRCPSLLANVFFDHGMT